MKKEIIINMINLINRLSECDNYSWSNDFKVEELHDGFEKFYNEVKNNIDFNNITVEEAKELGFNKFNDIWLIPLYLFKVLPKGLELTCISGEKVIVGEDYIDNDIRCGCIAYGIKINKLGENIYE